MGEIRVARFENADTETPKRVSLTLIHGAIFALRSHRERFSGEIFAEDRPLGEAVAISVVGGDELPLGGAAEAGNSFASGVQTAEEGHASGNESGVKVVPTSDVQECQRSRIAYSFELY